MNKVILIGRITKDIELRSTQNNISVAMFTIAVNRPKVNDKQETDFINCISWRKQAENLSKYCHKGDQIAIDGKLQTRKYVDKENKTHYITEVLCDSITFLESKKKETTKEVKQVVEKEDAFEQFADEVIINPEDLPF